MATVAGIVVHCVIGLIGWTAAVVSTGLISWFDIVDLSSSDRLILDWHK